VNVILKIRNFARGIVDAYGRGKEPEGSFADSRNLVPTKTGSLETTHGYSTSGGLGSLPTGYVLPDVDVKTTFDIAKQVHPPFPFSAENPTPYDARVYFFQDNQGTPKKHYALSKWFKNSTTPIETPVLLDERKEFTATGVTITGATTYTITVANALNRGLSTQNDYYSDPPWRIEFVDVDLGTTLRWATVKDYAYDGGTDTATFTTLENIGTGGLGWTVLVGGDSFVLRRWFHRPVSMVPTFDVPAGQCFEAGGRVRGCGGASSDENKFPWVSQYLDKRFFVGVVGGDIAYKGTYVDIMERSNPDEAYGTAYNISVTVNTPSVVTGSGVYFPQGRYYKFGFTLENDSGEESPLRYTPLSGVTLATSAYIATTVRVPLARLDKSTAKINLYMVENANGIDSSAYFVKSLDILNPLEAWTFDGKAFECGTASARISASEWYNRGGTYYARTGRFEETTQTRQIVSWTFTENVGGRQFFALFYDPNTSRTEQDKIRFCPVTRRGTSYDVIPSNVLDYETDVGSGDPGSIGGLAEDSGQLIVLKGHSLFSIFVNATPDTWVKTTISLKDGIVARFSLTKIPERGIVFADSDSFKLLRNMRVMPISGNIRNAYQALATKSGIVAWYDNIDRSINFTTGGVTDKTVYRGYLDFGGANEDGHFVIPFYKIVTANNVEFVATQRDSSVSFANQTDAKLFLWHSEDRTFDGSVIRPYLKTNNIIADESRLVLLDKVVLTKSGNGSAGTLDNKIYLDGASVQTFSSQSLAVTSLYQVANPNSKRMGRSVGFEYNLNASGESFATGKMSVDAIDFYGSPVTPPNRSA